MPPLSLSLGTLSHLFAIPSLRSLQIFSPRPKRRGLCLSATLSFRNRRLLASSLRFYRLSKTQDAPALLVFSVVRKLSCSTLVFARRLAFGKREWLCLRGSRTHSFEVCLNFACTYSECILISQIPIRGRNYAPLSQAFTGGVPPLERRGANLRSRKLDERLSRHGLGARRVALLAPRATFSQYWYPLDYVSARLKLFSRGVFIKARFAPL